MDLKYYSFAVVDPLNIKVLKKKYFKKSIHLFDTIPNQNQVKKFDIIIFAVKPQISEKVIYEYKNYIHLNNKENTKNSI